MLHLESSDMDRPHERGRTHHPTHTVGIHLNWTYITLYSIQTWSWLEQALNKKNQDFCSEFSAWTTVTLYATYHDLQNINT